MNKSIKAMRPCLHTGFILLSLLFTSFSAVAIDMQQVEKELTTTGAEGWIHGAVKDKGLFVFTIRNPKDFFDYALLSLVTRDSNLQAKLAGFSRHDKVRIRGTFMTNASPQKHVLVSAIELVKKYESAYSADAFKYNADVPGELLKKHKATFLVHAVAGDGHVLVLEYKNVVVPVIAVDNTLANTLSRNDLIRIRYVVKAHPHQPVHLEVDPDAKKPIKIVEAIKDINGKPADVEGTLVLFPKSPEISLNVFAVLQETKGGTNRQYTIVNFENPEVFKQMREKLQKVWDKYPGEYTNGRNKFVSKRLRVRVTGTFNQVSTSQANPQILINSPDNVQITEL